MNKNTDYLAWDYILIKQKFLGKNNLTISIKLSLTLLNSLWSNPKNEYTWEYILFKICHQNSLRNAKDLLNREFFQILYKILKIKKKWIAHMMNYINSETLKWKILLTPSLDLLKMVKNSKLKTILRHFSQTQKKNSMGNGSLTFLFQAQNLSNDLPLPFDILLASKKEAWITMEKSCLTLLNNMFVG